MRIESELFKELLCIVAIYRVVMGRCAFAHGSKIVLRQFDHVFPIEFLCMIAHWKAPFLSFVKSYHMDQVNR